MARFRCDDCSHEVTQGMKPFSCAKCGSKNVQKAPDAAVASTAAGGGVSTSTANAVTSAATTAAPPPGQTVKGFRCRECQHQAPGKMKPYACPQCSAKGTMEEVQLPAGAAKPVLVTPPTPAPVPAPPPPPPPPPTKKCSKCGTVLAANQSGEICASCAAAAVQTLPPPPTPTLTPAPTPVPIPPPPTPPPPQPRCTQCGEPLPAAGAVCACQRPASERIAWQYPASVAGKLDPQRNCPAIASDGAVYLCFQNKLVALAAEERGLAERWTYETGGRIPGSPVIGPDGLVRIHSNDGALHVVTPAGKRAHSPVQVGAPLGWSTPVVDDRNVTYVSGEHGGLWRIEPGERAAATMFFRGKQRLDSTGLVHDRVLYIGAENGCVYAIGLDGDRGVNQWDHLAERGRTGWFINAALALLPGPLVLAASHDDSLHAFDLTGEHAWAAPVGGQMLGSPVVDRDGSVYVGLSLVTGREAPTGALVRLDAHSHSVRWRLATDSPVEATPVIGEDGLVYFGDNDGHIYAATTDGQEVWRERVAAGVRSAGSLLPGRVLFGLENGQVVALRCDSPGLRDGGWPKFRGDATHSALATSVAGV